MDKRSACSEVTANPDGHHRAVLAEQIEHLRFCHPCLQVPHVQRRGRQLASPGAGHAASAVANQRANPMAKMRAWWTVLVVIVAAGAAVEAFKLKTKGWEYSGSVYRCNETVTEYFQVYQFENLFSKRNAPVAHAVGFWDYQSFITAAAPLRSPRLLLQVGMVLSLWSACMGIMLQP
ncbi:hypothetical protein GW17_00027165 [Ensete ventricosum]|nr:hypothetical protein GW17_00027165 [Ensete ventricosum]